MFLNAVRSGSKKGIGKNGKNEDNREENNVPIRSNKKTRSYNQNEVILNVKQ